MPSKRTPGAARSGARVKSTEPWGRSAALGEGSEAGAAAGSERKGGAGDERTQQRGPPTRSSSRWCAASAKHSASCAHGPPAVRRAASTGTPHARTICAARLRVESCEEKPRMHACLPVPPLAGRSGLTDLALERAELAPRCRDLRLHRQFLNFEWAWKN